VLKKLVVFAGDLRLRRGALGWFVDIDGILFILDYVALLGMGLAIPDVTGVYLVWSGIKVFFFWLWHPALLTTTKLYFVLVLLRKHSRIVRRGICVLLSF